MTRSSALTPMQEQYGRLKQEAGTALLFFRLGDFYELFGDDAVRAAPLLEVVLTSREVTPGLREPMCGVPHHAVDGYIARLLKRGLRVAVADQVEDPSAAKGLVRREIVRVYSPGTVTEPALLDVLGESLLAAVVGGPLERAAASAGAPGPPGPGAGPDADAEAAPQRGSGEAAATSMAVVDLSTGTVRVPLLDEGDDAGQLAWDELVRLRPTELVVPAGAMPAVAARYARESGAVLTEWDGADGAGETAPAAEGEAPQRAPALGLALAYATQTLRLPPDRALLPVETYRPSSYLGLDAGVQRTLELVTRLNDGSQDRDAEATLLSIIDRAVTPMGRRMLRFWLLHPLARPDDVRQRQDAVEELVRAPLFREGLRGGLRGVHDLERLATRAAREQVGPRELAALGRALASLPDVLAAVAGCSAASLQAQASAVDPLDALREMLASALRPDPPPVLRDGGVIADGYDAELDAMRAAGGDVRGALAALEAAERQRTGLRSLKVGFNRVFGYYFEVPSSQAAGVPAEWRRRQSLSGSERFLTPELRALEDRLTGADERALRRESALFTDLRARAAAHGPALQRMARALAVLDAFASLAEVAVRSGWARPVVDGSMELVIEGGRHPVVERARGAGRFVPNDTRLAAADPRLLLITGPNMAGKSTYMRQVAQVVILAQMGSYVPASRVRIGVCDRVFTRIGASDDLAGGRSTFMVEMTEVAAMLRLASRRSLLLLDEVGRGTGTLDGLAIAWAVAEDVSRRLRARTLFATHYHELTSVVRTLPGAHNVHVAVREEPDRVVFLHRLAEGATDRSYGIAVAALAGVPEPVIARAGALLAALQERGALHGVVRDMAAGEGGAVVLEPDGADAVTSPAPATALRTDVQAVALVRRLAGVDPLRLTPLQALDLLAVLQAEATAALGGADGAART